MSHESPAVEFYFEFSSPYGYIASELIENIARRHDRPLIWKPFLMGAAMKREGSRPLVDYPLKGAYSRHDMLRMARYYELPLVWPETFPVFSVHAARLVYWAADHDPAAASRLTHAFYRAVFVAGEDIAAPEVAATITAKATGLEAAAALAALKNPDVKARLRTETDGALDRGVFGSPFMCVDGELFWGVDRLAMLEEWLRRGGW